MFLTDAEQTTPEIKSIDWNALLDKVVGWCMTTGIKLLIALIAMIILFKITNVITKKIYKRLKNKKVDETILRVTTQTIRLVLKGLILLCFVGYVGIETASITAVISSCGIALGLALQGALSNVAGGIIIILMRPFKIGDYVFTNGESGTVEDIHMFYTTLVTPDNRVVHVPNGTLANNVIVNNSVKDKRRVDVVMSIAYDADFEKARQLIFDVCSKNELIDKTPEPFVAVGTYGPSSVDLNIRVWANNADYWTVHRYLMHEVKRTFDENGIEIPFNQLDVTIKNN